MTKTLINVRHNLMKLIDPELSKLVEVEGQVWETLSARRKSQSANEKSELMRAVSKKKGSKKAQMRAIEKTMIGELVRVSVTASHYNVHSFISVSDGASFIFGDVRHNVLLNVKYWLL